MEKRMGGGVPLTALASTKVGVKSSENCASALFGHLIFTPPMHDFFDFYCILV
jgi:hypothetical protein